MAPGSSASLSLGAATTNPIAPNSVPPGERLWRTIGCRPLVPLAAATASGCALGLGLPVGPYRDSFLDGALQAAAALLLIFAALWLAASKRTNRQAQWPQLGMVLLLVATFFGAMAARQKTPPTGDISHLVRGIAFPNGPQNPCDIALEGSVADAPEVSEFSVEFPLEVRTTSLNGKPLSNSGRVWMRVPAGTAVEAGDVVTAHAELSDLPRIGNPNERTRATRYIEARCWSMARVRQPGDFRVLRHSEGNALSRWIDSLRSGLPLRFERDFAARGLPFPHANAQLLTAMTFGEGGLHDPLPRQTRDAFRAAGLSHVLIASGTQIAILCALILGVLRLGGGHRFSLLAMIPALLLYALVVGGAASIWRAVICGVCVALALIRGRDVDGLSLWCLALIALLLADPLQLTNIGFQLTFAATWGLLVLAPALHEKTRPVLGKTPWGDLFLLSLSAQLATLPLSLYHFGRLSLAGFGSNMIAVPIAEILVGTGLLGQVFSPINGLNYLLTNWVQNTAYFSARLNGAGASALPLGLKTISGIYLALGLLLISNDDWHNLGALARDEARNWRRKHKKLVPSQKGALCLLALGGLWLWWPRERTLRVAVLDVGQGESIVIQSPTGRTVVIDGGTSQDEGRGDVGRGVIVPYLQSIGAGHLDAMILTHADSDHYNGLASVTKEVGIDRVIDGAATVPLMHRIGETDYVALRELWRQRHIPVIVPHAGQQVNLGDGAMLTILAPLSPPLESDNDNAVVARLDFGTTSFLFTADIEAAGEARLIQSGADLHCTVLKVGHHGSKTSSSAGFLRATHPQIAVLSCGRYNEFGHPSPQTLEHLAKRGVATFRTDRDGAVEIVSDGRSCQIQTYR